MIRYLRGMLELLEAQERKNNRPEPGYDPPFIPEKIPRNETQHEAWLRKARDDIRAGKAISANLMKPTKLPPRRPNQQSERHNGLWGWWS